MQWQSLILVARISVFVRNAASTGTRGGHAVLRVTRAARAVSAGALPEPTLGLASLASHFRRARVASPRVAASKNASPKKTRRRETRRDHVRARSRSSGKLWAAKREADLESGRCQLFVSREKMFPEKNRFSQPRIIPLFHHRRSRRAKRDPCGSERVWRHRKARNVVSKSVSSSYRLFSACTLRVFRHRALRRDRARGGRALTSRAWRVPRHHARRTRIGRGRERGRGRRGR